MDLARYRFRSWTARRLARAAGLFSLAASLTLGQGAAVSRADAPGACALAPAFAALRDRVGPGFVGTCVETPDIREGGDLAQSTTLGRFVWYQATERAAFTDNRQTWLTGPGPLLWDRRNDERFDWERDVSAGAPLPTGWGPATLPCLPVVDGWEFAWDGVLAAVRNACDGTRILVLSAVLLDGENGRSTGVTQSVAWEAPDGAQRTVRLPATMAGARAVRFLRSAASLDQRPALDCIALGAFDGGEHGAAASDADEGGGRCLAVDPWLEGTISALDGTPSGHDLLRAAVAAYVVVRRQAFDFAVYGFHEIGRNTAILDRRLDGESDWVRAAYLAHELRHALDDAAGLPFGPGRDCLDRETAAVAAEAQVWHELWGGRLPVSRTPIQRELNDSALGLALPHPKFAALVAARYRASCG